MIDKILDVLINKTTKRAYNVDANALFDTVPMNVSPDASNNIISDNIPAADTHASSVANMPDSNVDLEKIMKEFRIGDKKSNLMQLNMNDYFPNDCITKIASLLEQSDNISNKTYRVNFDPVQEIVLKKMVGEPMLNKRLIIEEHDFFKGIFVLNYYCSIVSKNYDVADSLYKFAVQLEKKDKSKDPVMQDVIEHILQNSLQTTALLDNYSERSIKAGYNSMKHVVDLSGARFTRVSPIYTGAAKIIKDSVTNLERYLSKIDSRADLDALIFTDALYPYILEDQNLPYVDALLEKKDFLKASVSALQIASKRYYADHIDTKLRGSYNA
jgi:hypothetical protein